MSRAPNEWEAAHLRPIPTSGIRDMVDEADRLEREGGDVIHLEIGQPDFVTPAHIRAAATAALEAGMTGYPTNLGVAELRRAIADKLKADNGIAADWEQEILVTAGAMEAVYLAVMAFLEPGDKVVVPMPSWPNYINAPVIAGAQLVPVRLDPDDDFQIDIDHLASVAPGAKMVIVVTPHNPTGAVQRAETLAEVSRIAAEHDLLVVSDEIYEKMLYEDAEHLSLAALDGMADRTITVNGLSKGYAMTGWRIGYAHARPALIGAMRKLHQYITGTVSHFGQWAAAEALRGDQSSVVAMVSEFARRRELVLLRLEEMPGIAPNRPKGAFYVFPRVSELGMSSRELAMHVLRQAHVALLPGTVFGPLGEGFVRVSYANSYENLERAMDRLADVLGNIAAAR